MRIDKRQHGKYRSTQLRFCSDDYYESLAALIVHSGITTGDVEFLQSEWCAQLLDFLGISLSGMELFSKYKEKKERRSVDNGKR